MPRTLNLSPPSGYQKRKATSRKSSGYGATGLARSAYNRNPPVPARRRFWAENQTKPNQTKIYRSPFAFIVPPFTRAFIIDTASSNTDQRPLAMPAEIAPHRTALGSVAKLLGELWLREVTLQRLQQLHADRSIGDSLKSLGMELPSVNADAVDAKIEELAIDYCQLLIGPKGHLSPVQSVWVAEQFQSSCVDAMKSFFELLPGYQPPGSFHDHIGVQLDFAGSVLIAADRLSDSGGDVTTAANPPIQNSALQPSNTQPSNTQPTNTKPTDTQSREDQQTQADQIVMVFFNQQVTWTGPLTQQVKSQAQTEFYRQLAEVTEKFLALFAAQPTARSTH